MLVIWVSMATIALASIIAIRLNMTFLSCALALINCFIAWYATGNIERFMQ
jgi:hypothetical protein